MLGQVYKICSPNTEKVYIGSTFKTLKERFRCHLKYYNQTTSKLIIDSGEAFIELLEELKVIDKDELRIIEQQYLELYRDIAVNRCYAFGKDAEYSAKYYQKNKDRMKARQKANYQKNKDRMSEYAVEYRKKNSYKIPCICGKSVTKTDMSKHIKSLKHKKYIANNKEYGFIKAKSVLPWGV